MTEWFDKRPGESLGGILIEPEFPDESGGVQMLYYQRPDWVRLPPELGEGERRVMNVVTATCPCDGNHEVRRYDLEGDDNLVVYECAINGFLWCRLKWRSLPTTN